MSPNDTILIVDDSEEDFEATRRALHEARVTNLIQRCCDGEDALDYLFRRGPFAEADQSPRPAVILLDLNMPGTDGREVLETIKNNDQLRPIPVIVLTTSSNREDIDQCYALGANSYMQKPVDLAGFKIAIERLKAYWFETAILPETSRQ